MVSVKKVLILAITIIVMLNINFAYAQAAHAVNQKICYFTLLDLAKNNVIPSDQFIKLLSTYNSEYAKKLEFQNENIEYNEIQKIVYNLIPNSEDIYQELNKQIFHFNLIADATPETIIFDYAWNDAYCFLFFAAANMYQMTNEIRYANLIADFYLRFLPRVDKKLGFIDETRGKSLEAWSTLSYGFWKSAVSWNAALLYPGIRLLQLGALPHLSQARKNVLLELKKNAPKIMSEFENEFYFKEDGSGYYFNPYSGYTEAFNRQALIILLYGQMYDLYKNYHYKEKYNRMITWFQKSLKLKQGTLPYYTWSYSKNNPSYNHLGDEIPGEALNKASLTLQMLFDQSSLNNFTEIEKRYFANNFIEQISFQNGKWNHFTSTDRNDLKELSEQEFEHVLAWYPLSIQNSEIAIKIEKFISNNPEIFPKGWLSKPRSIFYLTQRLLCNLGFKKEVSKKIVKSFAKLPESIVIAMVRMDQFVIASGNSRNVYFLTKTGDVAKKITLDNVITCFLKTKNGELFAGTVNGCLLKFNSGSFSFENVGKVSSDIWTLAESENGKIYAGTSNGIFTISFKSIFKCEQVLSTRRIWALNGNGEDVFFVGQDKSLFGINDTKLFMKSAPVLTEGRTIAIYKNNIFVGGIDGHIYVLDKNGVLRNTIRDVHSLPITAMTILNGSLFSIGLDGCIKRIDIETGEILYSTTLAPEQFRSLVNEDGVIFIGGSGGRIYKVVSSLN